MGNVPDDLYYSGDHLWVRPAETGPVRVGITDYAQDALGDVTEVTPPAVGDSIQAGQACGDIESTKSLSDLVAPLSGRVSGQNSAAVATPELINNDPYGAGWLIEVDAGADALSALMDATAYRRLVGG
jgi:glycine cleavage system H protein